MSAPQASPRSALRESVASSTTSRKASEIGERRLEPVPGLEAEVERRQHEERDHELDPEVVRVARERIRAEHLLRPAHRAEDVDPGLPRGDRLDEDLVEIDAAFGEHELDDAVHGVEADAAEERRERVPVEANPSPREQRDPRHEEPEVEDELHHPLRPLRERLGRVEVVEARQVEEREEEEEPEGDHRGARESTVVPLERDPRRRARGTPR